MSDDARDEDELLPAYRGEEHVQVIGASPHHLGFLAAAHADHGGPDRPALQVSASERRALVRGPWRPRAERERARRGAAGVATRRGQQRAASWAIAMLQMAGLGAAVRQSTLVRASARHTFDTFVTTIGAWWPVQPFSAGKDRVRDVTVEQRRGGRVYETWDDGTEIDWGTLLTWQPPERFTMTWTGTPATTEMELTFTALGPALTRVTVEHRGWEALAEEQLATDCALPGGYSSGAYSQGWATILACLAKAVAYGASPARWQPPATRPPPSAVFGTALAGAAPATEPIPVQTEVANERRGGNQPGTIPLSV